MPETDTIPVSASVASTGPGIRYIGDHAYAYSGVITVNNTTTTLLDFTTGVGYIVAKYQPSVNTDTSDNMFFKLLLNSVEIQATLIGSTTSNSPYEEVEILIPPLTRCVINCVNDSTATGRSCSAVFQGRVYGEK